MQTLLSSQTSGASVPIWLVTDDALAARLESLPPLQSAWVRAQDFAAERHRLLLLPAADGAIAGVLWGLGTLPQADQLSLWDAAPLPDRGTDLWSVSYDM